MSKSEHSVIMAENVLEHECLSTFCSVVDFPDVFLELNGSLDGQQQFVIDNRFGQ